jgi:hypothetical protein
MIHNGKRGGRREGAGRKKGGTNKTTQARKQAVAEIVATIKADGKLPLEVMLEIMRTTDSPEVQFEAAKAAAPYIHPRLNAVDHSGKMSISHEDALAALAATGAVLSGLDDENASGVTH